MKKRIITLFLISALAVCLMPVTSSAASELPDLSDKALWCMEKDILQHKADGYSYGDPSIDVPAWQEFLSQVQREIRRRKEQSIHG